MGRATFCTDRQDVGIHDCASQLVIFILSCANGWGNTQAFSINIAVQFPLSPIHAVFRSPYADPVLRSLHFRTSSYLQTLPSKEFSGYGILQWVRSKTLFPYGFKVRGIWIISPMNL